MGEVTKEIRSLRIKPVEVQTYVTQYEYDSWNRIQKLVYPDGERLDFGYNIAGNLTSLKGYKAPEGTAPSEEHAYTYLKQQGYDEFEQEVYRLYGNDTETRYHYDPVMRRLEQLKAESLAPAGGVGSFLIQNNHYAYDLVGNILKVENQLPIIRNALGGASSYEYQYDNLNRLTRAKGNYTGELTSTSYELKMSYNNLNSITKKELNHLSGGVQKGYTLDYSYNNPSHPHAPSEIMEIGKPKARTYQYDGNGNPLYYEEFKSFRSMVWDEENRLRGINDNGKLHLYTYDHTGERALKSSGESSTVVTNGLTSAVITHMDDYTAYVNPYFVVQKGRFTKHYFEGSSRIVSKLGEGTFHHPNRGISAGGIDYIRQNAQMQEVRDRYIKGSLTPPGPPTQHGIYASPEWTGQPYPSLGWQNIRQDQEPPEGWPRPPKFNEPGDVPGPPVQYGDPITPQTVKAGYGFIDNGIIEKNLYFYHPDHLGSSSYITDREGRITQHTEYIAFGEVLFEEHSTSRTMPYLFNGKELDTETGLYYYGARYYDPRVSLWLNVDPLAEKAPNWTPYRYGFNNPIQYTDPTGMFESRKDARTYRKENNIDGRIIRNKDKTYSIIDKNNIVYTRGDDSQYTLDAHRNDGVIEEILLQKTKSSWKTTIFDITSTSIDIVENLKWNKMSTAQKSKFVWDVNKKLASKMGYKLRGSTSSWYRQKIPKGFTKIGYGTAIISGTIIAFDVIESNQIRASHVLETAITGASFIPGWGWVVGGLYLGADLLTTGITGSSIGEHLDQAVEEHYGLDDGALINF